MTEFLESWGELTFVYVAFFLSHIIPVHPTIREWLIRGIGKTIYLAVYSMLSIVLFGWLIVAADLAPYVAVWNFSPWQLWLPNIVIPIACLLFAFGITASNLLSIASSNNEAFEPDHPGIAGLTRQPVLWAAALERLHMQCQTAISPISRSLAGLARLASWHGSDRCPESARPRYSRVELDIAQHVVNSARCSCGGKLAAVIRANQLAPPGLRDRSLYRASRFAWACHRRITAAVVLALPAP